MAWDLNALLAATTLFVGGHFLLSSDPLRSRLVAALGETLFRRVYGLIMLAAFAFMLLAYREAPWMPVWRP
jgi:uncharacterized membrane protein